MKRAKAIKLISIGTILAGVWYFAIKDHNYKITFTSPQAPGSIYSDLLQWNAGEDPETTTVTLLSKKPFSELQQQVTVHDSVFIYHWRIERKTDSLTKITALVKDGKNSFLQKLKVPFFTTDFEKKAIATVKEVRDGLRSNEKYYRVSSVREGSAPSAYCAYIPLSATVRSKGAVMIKNINLVMEYLKGNNIALTGDPFVEVTRWNVPEDSIHFNFCFPVKKRDTFPETAIVKFRQTKEKKALTTRFNGNYKISDRGWYTLIAYAENHNINIEQLPVEIYRNDPHSGGDELQWEAEIYMPIKTK